MKRRTHLRLMLATLCGWRLGRSQSAPGRKPIQLFVEMKVDSKSETEMLDNFHNIFYESEELRQKWIASPEHKRVWPTVEKALTPQQEYPVLLFDEM